MGSARRDTARRGVCPLVYARWWEISVTAGVSLTFLAVVPTASKRPCVSTPEGAADGRGGTLALGGEAPEIGVA